MTNELTVRDFEIPASEMEITFVRSSGPGGQKVNKTSSRAQLRWNVDASAVFSVEEKEKIKAHCVNRMNKVGEIVLAFQQERSQLQNKEAAIRQLHALVCQALTPVAERIETHPTYSSKQKRLDAKTKDKRKKERRGKVTW